mgnify:CR=1 FL=1
MELITFFTEDISFQIEQPKKLKAWLNKVASHFQSEIREINYIYCSDNYILEINKTYLSHDYYTDIITFDQRDDQNQPIAADIFISIDRVHENAGTQQISFSSELHRVMVHGLLHLIGYNDKTKAEAEEMRKTEDASLSLLVD